MPITRSILNIAETDPRRPAISDGSGMVITYRDIAHNSAGHMLACTTLLGSITPERQSRLTIPSDVGDIPVITLSLSVAVDASMLVAMLAGYRVVTVVLDPLWPAGHRIRSVKHSGARIVITDDTDFIDVLKRNDWPGVALHIDEYLRFTEETLRGIDWIGPKNLVPGPVQPPTIRPDDEPFMLIFTSGTTDQPKGFLRTRKSWRYNVGISEQYLMAEPAMRTFAPGPLAYSLTLYAFIEVLATGGTLYLQSRFDAIEAANLIEKESIERLVAVPAVLPALAQAAKRHDTTFTYLSSVVVGGANLSAALRSSFIGVAPKATILSYYGAAEIGFIGYSLGGEGALLEPFGGLELSVRDGAGKEIREGELGTLHVRVGSQGDRYISTTGGAAITGSDGWSTVNDQARLQNGKILLEGRAGDIAITGGHKVSLVQIERALEAVPGCESCCAVTQPHATLGEIIVAIIELPEAKDMPPKAEILAALKETLPPQFVPHRMYTTTLLPRTVGGKIRRVEVREELELGNYQRL